MARRNTQQNVLTLNPTRVRGLQCDGFATISNKIPNTAIVEATNSVDSRRRFN